MNSCEKEGSLGAHAAAKPRAAYLLQRPRRYSAAQARLEFYVDVFEDKLAEGSLLQYLNALTARPCKERSVQFSQIFEALELIGEDADVWRTKLRSGGIEA